MFEKSFEITRLNDVEANTVLPSRVNTTSAKIKAKTTGTDPDTECPFLRHPSNFSQDDTMVESPRMSRNTPETLSESIRFIMDLNLRNGNSTIASIPELTDSSHYEIEYRFRTFYHPYAYAFIRELNRNGVDGLLQRSTRLHLTSFCPLP